VHFTKYYQDEQIKDEVGWLYSTNGGDENVYGILVEKPEGKT
jgi:hypothetical protein